MLVTCHEQVVSTVCIPIDKILQSISAYEHAIVLSRIANRGRVLMAYNPSNASAAAAAAVQQRVDGQSMTPQAGFAYLTKKALTAKWKDQFAPAMKPSTGLCAVRCIACGAMIAVTNLSSSMGDHRKNCRGPGVVQIAADDDDDADEGDVVLSSKVAKLSSGSTPSGSLRASSQRVPGPSSTPSTKAQRDLATFIVPAAVCVLLSMCC